MLNQNYLLFKIRFTLMRFNHRILNCQTPRHKRSMNRKTFLNNLNMMVRHFQFIWVIIFFPYHYIIRVDIFTGHILSFSVCFSNGI